MVFIKQCRHSSLIASRTVRKLSVLIEVLGFHTLPSYANAWRPVRQWREGAAGDRNGTPSIARPWATAGARGRAAGGQRRHVLEGANKGQIGEHNPRPSFAFIGPDSRSPWTRIPQRTLRWAITSLGLSPGNPRPSPLSPSSAPSRCVLSHTRRRRGLPLAHLTTLRDNQEWYSQGQPSQEVRLCG
jgi:hypothetical protein